MRAFHGNLFDFTLRGRPETMVFIGLGAQFLVLQRGTPKDPDGGPLSAW